MIRNIRYGLKNLIIFFKVIWNFRPWDYVYSLELFQAGLKELLHCLENGSEIDETRLPKEKSIKRAIEILDNIIKDNDNYNKIGDYAKSQVVESQEFNELKDILFGTEHNLKEWWD